MSGGVIQGRSPPLGGIHLGGDVGTGGQRAALHPPEMQSDTITLLLGIADGKLSTVAAQPATVTHLTAGLGIEGSPVENHHALLAFLQGRYRLAVTEQGGDLCAVLQSIITAE